MGSDISIFMCCHKTIEYVPPLCIPVQGGRAINPPVSGTAGDDTGDNISDKNREYCELTVMYHAWKNINADHYGFCHYRRFFCTDESVKRPYIALGKLSEKNARRYLGDEAKLSRLCADYDIILPRAEEMGVTVREHYCNAPFHYEEDLRLFLEILGRQAPALVPYAQSYLEQTKHYFCNMFIMSRERFNEYCSILFPVLEEFDRYKAVHGDFQSDRTDGYLAERFVGIYLDYAVAQRASVRHIARLDVGCTLKKRLKYHLLPPESRGRLALKKLLKRTKG